MLRGFVIFGLIMFSVSILSASAEMWKDSFDGDTISDRWKPGVSVGGNPPSDWKVDGGVLKGHWVNQGMQLLLMEYPSPDYTIQVKCRLDKGSNPEGGAGIVFHSYGIGHDPAGWQGTSEFYSLHMHRTGFRLWRIGAGWWDTIVDKPPMGDAKEHSDVEWYTLKLVLKDSNLRGYVNDELLFETQNDRFAGNFVGLVTGMFTDASFDDLVITNQEEVSTVVSPEGMLMATWSRLKNQ